MFALALVALASLGPAPSPGGLESRACLADGTNWQERLPQTFLEPAMYLDKASQELVLKIVYAGEGRRALEEVSTLAGRAKLPPAVISLLGDSVRTFKLSFPTMGKIRGFTPSVEVVGVSIDGLTAAVGAAEADRTILKTDALVFVLGPEEPRARKTFERLRVALRAEGLKGADTPLVIMASGAVDPATELGVQGVPAVTGRDAATAALKEVLSGILKDVLRGLGD